VGVPSPETVWVCGRICCDATEGKLNQSSVVLEGSWRESRGKRVELDLTTIEKLSPYALFPGQVVLVEGVNASGKTMVVTRLVEGAPKPRMRSPRSLLKEYNFSSRFQNGAPLSVYVASGPFTTSDNLSYEPFQDLLRLVLVHKPDVVVLLGPFVDSTQPLLSEGKEITLTTVDDRGREYTAGATYEMVFIERIVRDGLRAMFNAEDENGAVATQFIFVPALQDAHHHFVYPQPPFPTLDLEREQPGDSPSLSTLLPATW